MTQVHYSVNEFKTKLEPMIYIRSKWYKSAYIYIYIYIYITGIKLPRFESFSSPTPEGNTLPHTLISNIYKSQYILNIAIQRMLDLPIPCVLMWLRIPIDYRKTWKE